MVDTEALRKKVIDLAIQGKLTKQLPEDGNAEDLYVQLQEEKKELFKARKNSFVNALSNISLDEIPFDIPSNWKWVRLNDIVDVSGGSQPPKSMFEDKMQDGYVRLYQIRDYGEKPVPVYVPQESVTKFSKEGDVLLARYGGSLGKVFLAHDGAYNVAIAKIVPLFNESHFCNRYFYYYFQASLYQSFIRGQGNSRSAQSGFNQDDLNGLLFPLPPLKEQERIVDIIDAVVPILAFIDTYQQQYLLDLSVLKEKIIDAGVRGKLTEQLPEDGNAEELFIQIQKEKTTLIKEGKLKKEKALPVIADDEIPFDIPSNWKWVRIGQLFTLQAGKNITSSDISVEQTSKSKYPCFGGNGLRGYVDKTNVAGKHILIGRQGALCGNINVAENSFWATEHAVVVYQYANTDVDYYALMLKTLNLNKYATSVAQPGLAVSTINKVLIPLPPLTEQKRIARITKEMLSIIE